MVERQRRETHSRGVKTDRFELTRRDAKATLSPTKNIEINKKIERKGKDQMEWIFWRR